MLVVGAAMLIAGGCATRPSSASLLWRADFEQDGWAPWSYRLNPRGGSLIEGGARDGRRAARLELTAADVWKNGLNRVELQHDPGPLRVREGEETWFGWSFFLPRALLPGEHALGYWESRTSYQQLMAFEGRGQEGSFVTRLPSSRTWWRAPQALTAGRWHDVVLHVRWSADPSRGEVELVYDGERVARAAPVATLVPGESAFIQVGLLRPAADAHAGTEEILIDRAREGRRLADVIP
jgi:hypothetical protein